MKKLFVLIIGVLIVGCTNQEISGTYRKQFYGYVEGSFPHIMEYVIEKNKILTYTSISYAIDEEDMLVKESILMQDYESQFGKEALTIKKGFDKDEELYKVTIIVDYNKIDNDILNKYLEKNNESKENILTVDGIHDFDSYEKVMK